MADAKISALTNLTAADAINDMIPIVDVSDTPPASGNTKRISINNILSSSPTASGALTVTGLVTAGSATITGALVVDTTTLVVDATNDRVGVGTASPATRFHVALAAATYGEVARFYGASGNGISLTANGSSGFNQITSTAAQPLIFNVNSGERYRLGSDGTATWSVAGTTAMTLNSTGLGIRVVPVAARLQLAYTEVNTIPAAGATTGHNFAFGSTVFGLAGGSLSTGDSYLQCTRWDGTASNYNLLLNPNGGNVGVGVTPSAFGGTFKAVQVSYAAFRGSTATAGLSFNSYFDGTDFRYIAASTKACDYFQNSGKHVWQIANTGSAGGVIAFTQAMTLDDSGNLLVGNTGNPNTARAYFRYDTLTTQSVINSATIVAASTGWNHFLGQSGDGSSITTNNIFIRGNGDIVNANGVYGTISDLRLKENISDARNYLADLLKLRVVKYSLKSEESDVATKIGFIAQEVEQVFPSLITTDTDDNKSIKTSVLIPMLLKAIQELTARVQTLEAR